MNSIEAFARGKAAEGNESKVFDWDRAAQLIRERKPSDVSAGLSMDWEWTGGDIYRDGAPVLAEDTYVYLASKWATPEINMDGDVIDCYKMQSQVPDWNSDTYWPDSALQILKDG